MLSNIGLDCWIAILIILFCIMLNIGIIVTRVFSARFTSIRYEIMAAILKIIVLLLAGMTCMYLHPVLSTMIPKWLIDGVVLFAPIINEMFMAMTPALICFGIVLILFSISEKKQTSLPRWFLYLCDCWFAVFYLLYIMANQHPSLYIVLVLIFFLKSMDIVDRAYMPE